MGNIELNTMQRCPSNTDFIKYLNGSAEDSFIVLFEEHIEQCNLCKEALEGYKGASLFYDTNKLKIDTLGNKNEVQKLTFSKWTTYAAAIAVLFSLTFLFANRKHKFNKQYAHIELEMNQNKTLMHKSTTEYWYFGENETVAINDQLISKEELQDAISTIEPKTQVIVQIEDTKSGKADNIISSIKLNQKIPVYTISKQKGLKAE